MKAEDIVNACAGVLAAAFHDMHEKISEQEPDVFALVQDSLYVDYSRKQIVEHADLTLANEKELFDVILAYIQKHEVAVCLVVCTTDCSVPAYSRTNPPSHVYRVVLRTRAVPARDHCNAAQTLPVLTFAEY